jgi:hypothetical protein
MVAGLLDQVVEASSFATEDEDAVGLEVELGVVGRAALVEAENPDVLLLHLFEGAHEVGDASDAHVLGGSGGGLGYGRGDGSGAALGEDDSIDSGSVGSAEESPEIVGVLDAVEGEEKLVLAFFLRSKEVFDGEELTLFDESQHALMHVCFRDAGELIAGFERDANACGAAELDETFEALVATLAGDADVVKLARTGTDGLLDWVKTVKNFHVVSLPLAFVAFRGGVPPRGYPARKFL